MVEGEFHRATILVASLYAWIPLAMLLLLVVANVTPGFSNGLHCRTTLTIFGSCIPYLSLIVVETTMSKDRAATCHFFSDGQTLSIQKRVCGFGSVLMMAGPGIILLDRSADSFYRSVSRVFTVKLGSVTGHICMMNFVCKMSHLLRDTSLTRLRFNCLTGETRSGKNPFRLQ